jgi:hypothetical protein
VDTPVQAASPDIPATIERLRLLIAIPKKQRNDEWRARIAPLVAQLSLDFPGQTEPVLALQEAMLIAQVADLGSREAKARDLKLERWFQNGPPHLSSVAQDQKEAAVAIKLLRSIRADWVIGYTVTELSSGKWPKLTTDLAAWLIQTSKTGATLCRILAESTPPAGVPFVVWVGPVLASITRALLKKRLFAGSDFMAGVASLASMLDEASNKGSEKSDRQKASVALLKIVAIISTDEPAVLLQGPVPSILRMLCAGKPAPAKPIIESLAGRTLDLLKYALGVENATAVTFYRNLWATYRSVFPKADDLVSWQVESFPVLRVLTSFEPFEVCESIAGLETVVADLVVNWDDFELAHGDLSGVRQLTYRVQELMKLAQVERLGTSGEVVPYDPIAHRLPENCEPPAKVVIKRSGLILRREDGSTRVLLAAVVASVQ